MTSIFLDISIQNFLHLLHVFYSADADDYLPENTDVEMEDVNLDYESQLEYKKSRGGRPRKDFSQLESKSQRLDRLRPIYNQCVEFCKNEKIPFHEFLGLMGKLYYFSEVDDRDWQRCFKAISCGDNPIIKHTMSVERSVCLKIMCSLGSIFYVVSFFLFSSKDFLIFR